MSSLETIAAPVKAAEGGARTGRPELLAPAGDWDCAKAAVENGADAIYFGLERFNARMRAQNFTVGVLPKLMEFLHRRGVKGYVTFNTLVFANELAEAEDYLRSIIAAGVDAAIVQDVGICRLIRRLSPDFPIHASTQMTVSSAAGVEFARELGCNLVVLARECSIKEIEKIQAAQGSQEGAPYPGTSEGDVSRETRDTATEVLADGQVAVPKIRHSPLPSRSLDAPLPNPPPARSSRGEGEEAAALESQGRVAMPLEVFVHGALCVAYSGQCLTSEALGGRSANRGECAQACRMPYELVSDGAVVPLGARRYLLSPQDLSGMEVLPELMRAGVASLKIEGRLKTAEYVANITRVYRRALDAALYRAGFEAVKRESRYDLEMGFSRGLFTGWFGGNNNQALVHARFGKKRGVYLGDVLRIHGERVAVKLAAPLKPGDGVVFDAGRPDQDEEGGFVYTMEAFKEETLLGFGHGDLDFTRIHVGDKIWKTSDPVMDRRLRQSFAGEKPHFQQPVEMEVHGAEGLPLTLIARDAEGNVAQVESAMALARAEKTPLSMEKLREQLGRLGGTPLSLGVLKNNLAGEVMLPVSELNRMRREAAQEIEMLRARPRRWTLNPPANPPHHVIGGDSGSAGKTERGEANLIVLVRNLAQLEAALECGAQTLYCDFEDAKKYREAVAMVHCASGCAAPQRSVWVAPPRIFKMGEEWILKLVRSCNADGYLVRNYDHLKYFADARRVGDFSLNAANPLTAEYFKTRFGLERVTVSYDLNVTQLEALLRAAPPEWFEITIHQHMPMFHMEHCVFCAFLSTGTDYTNCGRPCDKHDVRLRDRVGAEHPLKADLGCRNTVFNSMAQTGAEFVAKMLELGARDFRIEFLNETPEQVKQTISKYRQLLRGEIEGAQVWRELKLMNQLGVTRGQMAGGKQG
jgi:putative protease